MDAPDREHEERLERAREAFEEYLRRRASGDYDFDSYATSYPELTQELQTLHSEWVASREEASSSGSWAPLERLEKLARQAAAAPSRYELKGELGRGGMGSVFEVWDTDLRRSIAMKVLRGEVRQAGGDSGSSASLVRFLEEAQITAQIGHPGVVPVHELGVDAEGRVYFTMGRVKGRTLKDVIAEVHGQDPSEREPWSLTRALRVILKVCETMAFAHAKGVVHRDLKPTNVMIGRFGEVFVMDWGLSCAKGREDLAQDVRPRSAEGLTVSAMQTDRRDAEGSDPESPVVTMDGAVLGTPAYMSPEQARGQVETLGPRSDVYSVGAMLYQLLSGRTPYIEPGMRVSPHTVLALVISGPPQPLHKIARQVPAELAAICDKAMAREPSERYADMGAFAEDLHAYLDDRVVRAYETGAWAEFRKWTKRNRGLALSLGVALAATVVALATWILQRERMERERMLEADLYRLEYYLSRSEELWPAVPSLADEMEAWLDDVRLLADRRAVHTRRLEDLRRTHLDAEARAAGDWRFDDLEVQGRHDALVGLVEGLARLASDDPGAPVPAMEARLAFARDLRRRSIEVPADDWADAARGVAELPGFEGFELRPQLGLVPLGPDPDSGLWEFAHLATGEVPARDDRDQLVLGPRSAVVLVLIPGGTFRMGAERPNPLGATRSGPNLDAGAHSYEGPVHEVTLAPFFVAKFELNQAQWRRATGETPSLYRPDSAFADRLDAERGWLHPVESVSWLTCERVLARVGLVLPTEAQWERAARGGTASVFAHGDAREDLIGAANLADEAAKRMGAQWQEIGEWPGFDDGWGVHAPVTELVPNDYGLHQVHGNVMEWCRDWFVQYRPEMSRLDPGDGYRRAVEAPYQAAFRILRGGSFRHGVAKTRLSARYYQLPGFIDYFVGVRPARAVEE